MSIIYTWYRMDCVEICHRETSILLTWPLQFLKWSGMSQMYACAADGVYLRLETAKKSRRAFRDPKLSPRFWAPKKLWRPFRAPKMSRRYFSGPKKSPRHLKISPQHFRALFLIRRPLPLWHAQLFCSPEKINSLTVVYLSIYLSLL